MRFLFCIIAAAILASCAKPPVSGWQTFELTAGNGQVPVFVYVPRTPSVPAGGYPFVIALHGWDLRAEEWKASGIEALADEHSILVVCPQMGKANYEKEFFPETTMKWNSVPSGPWIKDTLLKELSARFQISSDKKKRGLLGVSTGGRGALLVAGYYPEDFGFAGMISGDFDVSKTPEDGLALGTFGPFKEFEERWRQGSAIAYMDSYRSVRVYLAHSAADRVAPVSQARLAAAEFKKAQQKNSSYVFAYEEASGGGHDWQFWKKALPNAVKFFAAGF